MRHFFLDTNVVFDYLGRREPNGAAAASLFQAAYEGRATLYVASLSFSHVFYTLRKQFGAQPAREALRKLARLVRVVAVDEGVVQAALDSEFADVEDAMQYFAAHTKSGRHCHRRPKRLQNRSIAGSQSE
jgi:predicted nucleic acid-binding protein